MTGNVNAPLNTPSIAYLTMLVAGLSIVSEVSYGLHHDIHSVYLKRIFGIPRRAFLPFVRGADNSLARPGRKQATATEDFDVHISYL